MLLISTENDVEKRKNFFAACRNIIGFDTRGSARNCITHYPGFLARRNSIPATIIVGQENGAYPSPPLIPQTDTNETRTSVLRILGRRLPSIRLAVITEPRPTLLLSAHVYASSVENVRHAAPSHPSRRTFRRNLPNVGEIFAYR